MRPDDKGVLLRETFEKLASYDYEAAGLIDHFVKGIKHPKRLELFKLILGDLIVEEQTTIKIARGSVYNPEEEHAIQIAQDLSRHSPACIAPSAAALYLYEKMNPYCSDVRMEECEKVARNLFFSGCRIGVKGDEDDCFVSLSCVKGTASMYFLPDEGWIPRADSKVALCLPAVSTRPGNEHQHHAFGL